MWRRDQGSAEVWGGEMWTRVRLDTPPPPALTWNPPGTNSSYLVLKNLLLAILILYPTPNLVPPWSSRSEGSAVPLDTRMGTQVPPQPGEPQRHSTCLLLDALHP